MYLCRMQKVTYIRRRAKLKKDLGSGLLLFLGNNEVGMNYVDNTYRFRQDSTFLYFFGLDYPGLIAVIDVDDDIEIAEGMKQLGIMRGDPAEAAEIGAYAMFFPCGLGHMMGLDVHDMESLGEQYV